VPILVTCKCGQQFQTRDENAGRRARCPECGNELVIPKPGEIPDDFAGLEPVTMTAASVTSGKAIASLVLGLCSFLCTIFTGLPAIIFGLLSLSDINKGRGRIGGTGMAVTGIILGGLGSTMVLIALLLPAVQAAREAARRAQCVNNMRQIGLAMHNFHSSYNFFPPAAITDKEGRPLLSWRVAILPYIEQQSLYQQFHLDEPWDSAHNINLVNLMPQTYACPSTTPTPGKTIYQVFVGPKTMFPPGRKGVRIMEVTDGTSNTLLVAEAAQPVTWTAPDDLSFGSSLPMYGAGSPHPGGFNSLFADGSVRFLKQTIVQNVLAALISRDGGEVVSGY
jgi:prepilin-type processing-associated H-X9-DG protein